MHLLREEKTDRISKGCLEWSESNRQFWRTDGVLWTAREGEGWQFLQMASKPLPGRIAV